MVGVLAGVEVWVGVLVGVLVGVWVLVGTGEVVGVALVCHRLAANTRIGACIPHHVTTDRARTRATLKMDVRELWFIGMRSL